MTAGPCPARGARFARHLVPTELLDQGFVGNRVQPPGRHQTGDDAQRPPPDEVHDAIDPVRRGRPDPVRHAVAVSHRRGAEPREQIVLGGARGADHGVPAQPASCTSGTRQGPAAADRLSSRAPVHADTVGRGGSVAVTTTCDEMAYRRWLPWFRRS